MLDLLRRVHYLLNRRRLERELQNDIEVHREMISAEDRKDFGNPTLLRERSREAWGWSWLDRLVQDLRFGLRLLKKSPALAFTAIAVLALGIGINVTAFNVVDIMFFKPLPVRDPQSLVRFTMIRPNGRGTQVVYPAVAFYRKHNTVLSEVLAQSSTHMTMSEGTSEAVRAGLVTGNYFNDLGATAAYGRLFSPADEKTGSSPVVVLGYGFWQRRFGRDASVVGSVVRLNHHPATVIGVTSFDFVGLDPEHGERDEVWTLFAQQPYFTPESKLLTSFAFNDSAVKMYGRLKPGISMKAAEAALQPLSEELAREHPDTIKKGQGVKAAPGGYAATFSPDDAPGFALFGALVLLILCVACGNLGNLLLGHAITREREVAIRLALGATRARITRQFMTESLLLAIIGSAAGLLLSFYASRTLVAVLGGPMHIDFAPDWRTTLFSFGLGALASILFGMPPARHAARQLQHRSRMRTIFMGAQIAASCVLLVVAGLLVRGLHQVFSSDLGFDYKHVVVVDPQLYAHAYTPAKAGEYMRALQLRVAEEPGAVATTLAAIAPMGHRLWLDNSVNAYVNAIKPGYFRTLSIPILRGRDFTEKDVDVAMVSDSYARKVWPGKDPLQQTVEWDNKQLPVIGIAANAPIMSLRDRSAVELYVAATDKDLVSSVMMVKTAPAREAMSASLGKVAGSLDAVLSPESYSLRASFDDKVSDTEKMAGVVSGMGALALTLALIGLWGVVSYTVSQRTREIGIRVALGATPGRIVETIVARFLLPVSLSLVAGIVLAALLSMALRHELYGLSNFDSVSYVGAVVLLAVASSVAALIPARRATKVDPMVALRCE